MGILDRFTSDWETTDEMVVFHPEPTPSGDATQVSFYDAKIEDHSETGERRLYCVENRGSELLPVYPEELPDTTYGERWGGRSSVKMYSTEFIMESFNIDTIKTVDQR